jgi:hypothetical protein
MALRASTPYTVTINPTAGVSTVTGDIVSGSASARVVTQGWYQFMFAINQTGTNAPVLSSLHKSPQLTTLVLPTPTYNSVGWYSFTFNTSLLGFSHITINGVNARFMKFYFSASDTMELFTYDDDNTTLADDRFVLGGTIQITFWHV